MRRRDWRFINDTERLTWVLRNLRKGFGWLSRRSEIDTAMHTERKCVKRRLEVDAAMRAERKRNQKSCPDSSLLNYGVHLLKK